jgi:hypothetical protein
MISLRNIILAMCFLGFSISCKRFDEFTQFELNYKQSITIPSSSIIDLPINVMTPEVESNSESEFAINDTRKDLIEEIILTKLTLNLTSPSDGNFNFLNKIDIFIRADGVDESLIAYKQNIQPAGNKSIELETVDTDLQDYIKKDRFVLRVETKTDEATTRDHHIDILSTFFVDAKIVQ